MAFLVEGFKYGLIAGGWLLAFGGVLILFVSFCTFLGWIISLFT